MEEVDHVQVVRAGAMSRRRVLGGAAGALVAGGLGALGTALGEGLAGGATATHGSLLSSVSTASRAVVVKSPPEPAFKSRPDLLPPTLQSTLVQADPGGGLIFLTPSALPTNRGLAVSAQVGAGLGQPGAMILDEQGHLIWFQPTDGLAANLQVQSYDGKPVLTYWEGRESNGFGFGTGYILDQSYQQVARVNAGHGVQADLHELQLTAEGTALVTAYATRAADLSSLGGSSRGAVVDGVVQEIDVRNGEVRLDWRSLDYVPFTDSYAPLGSGPFDYFHVNSAGIYGQNELLVSSRNTWRLYRIDRTSGELLARINGRVSDYAIGPGAGFSWQHHARRPGPGVVTLFDDAATPAKEPRSRGLVLAVDDAARTVRLSKAFTHPANLLTPFEGSMQLLGDGGAFVGWGGQPYFSQFAANGAIVYDGRFPTGAQSYRAFRSPWVGTPAAPPDVALERDTLGQTVVYVSWNGATQVSSWQVLSGDAASRLEVIATVPKAGFETAISTRPTGALLAVAALDAGGARLVLSAPLRAPT